MALTKLEEILEDNLDYQFVEQGAISRIKDCCRIYAQSQTQELQLSLDSYKLAHDSLAEQNKDLVEMLSLVCMDLEERGRAYGDAYTMSKELLTKYNHLNKKP